MHSICILTSIKFVFYFQDVRRPQIAYMYAEENANKQSKSNDLFEHKKSTIYYRNWGTV